MSNYFIS